ncbi:hypothetical protein M885DRAFT_620851, partial [Pelagophyceae sp. CCMP2097]
ARRRRLHLCRRQRRPHDARAAPARGGAARPLWRRPYAARGARVLGFAEHVAGRNAAAGSAAATKPHGRCDEVAQPPPRPRTERGDHYHRGDLPRWRRPHRAHAVRVSGALLSDLPQQAAFPSRRRQLRLRVAGRTRVAAAVHTQRNDGEA